ncbi:hypothetical protein [Sulfurimonas sp. HSL3-7]|uniref:hypothetical protein n=1 Tax=Sulfonitrofixus jiaomeiensis TaxID=3131938 RepID=UPI0031F8C48A
MTVKITNNARIKDYIAVLGNSVTVVGGSDEKLALRDADASIIVKAMTAGQGYIIEDTTMTINAKTYHTVSRHDPIHNGDKAVWSTKMAYHSGYMIHFYETDITGHIKIDPSEHTGKLYFGDIFVPEGYDLTICEIERRGVPFENARRRVLTKMLLGESFHTELIEPITKEKVPVSNIEQSFIATN